MLVGFVLLSVHTRYQAQRDEEIAQRNQEIAEEREARMKRLADGTGSSNVIIGAYTRANHNESLCLAPCEAEDEQGEQE